MISRLRWYKNRLAAMSSAEILYRVRETLRHKTDRVSFRRFIKPPRDYDDLPELPGLAARLDAWQVPPGLLAQWQEDAHRAQNRDHFMFGKQWPSEGRDEMWHIDPISGTLWPRDVFCFAIDYRHTSSRGDIKFVWELNRLQYLQPIAALARKQNNKELAQFCLAEIESWIDNNPPFRGVNWNSGIELALRIISILTVISLVGHYLTRGPRAKIWATLEMHAHWIARYPSRFSSANNHRTAEGLGLLAIGALCPHFADAEEWKKTGWAILCDAAQVQILPDGVGAEQATAYAAAVLETLLTGLVIASHTQLDVPDFYRRKLALSGEYLRWMTDTHNNQPLIGDDDNACVFGSFHPGDHYVSSVLGCVAALTSRPDLTPPRPEPHLRQAMFGFAPTPEFAPYGARMFAHGGVTIGRHNRSNGDILLAFDHGYLGYLSIAAHGHADSLALWLHIGGQPIFVDAGTYLYHSEAQDRRLFRSTGAHNTLQVADTDASTMSGNFNWSHKAQCTVRSFTSDGSSWHIEAEHDGYLERFHVLHRRSLHVSPASGAVIEDCLIGSEAIVAEIGFLLHPALTARVEDKEVLIMKGEQLILRMRPEGPLAVSLGEGWYSPSFGIKKETLRISLRGVLNPAEKMLTHLFWAHSE